MQGIPYPFVRANQWFIVLSVILSLIVSKPIILMIPFLVGLFSLLFKQNLVFWIVRPFLKKPISSYLQEDAAQQRFNQWISVICLGLSLIGFAIQMPVVAYGFAIMVAVAALVAIMGFCIGCFIRLQYLQWQHHRRSREM